MRRVDDGVEILDPHHPQVRDRKAAALILVRRQLLRLGPPARSFISADSAESDFLSASRRTG
jgi:hypothetical protein